MEESIQIDPSKPEGIQRLRDILANGGSGMMELVWGPDLNVMSTDAIYNGLGLVEPSGSDNMVNVRLWGNVQNDNK
jgi:hypothetical protein